MSIINAVNVNYNCLEDNFIFRNRVHRSAAEVCPEGCHTASDVCKTLTTILLTGLADALADVIPLITKVSET